MRSPDEIMRDFDAAVTGQADIDPRDVLWEILDDIQKSYDLAMQSAGVERIQRQEIGLSVEDYIANNYGDE
jgi:hypothetical protein